MASTTKKPANHFAHGYEFGGPIGTSLITFGLPVLCYIFAFGCNDVSGCPAPALLNFPKIDLQQLKAEVGWPQNGFWGLASWEATGWTLAYYLFSGLLYRFLPATEIQGTTLSTGGKLNYRFNAFSSAIFTLVLCAAGTIAQGADFPLWTFIADNYVQILTANILIAYFLATFVYVRSFSVKSGNKDLRELAPGGVSGNLIYDFYIGRELNPRVTIPIIGEIDIKEWMELRPGMLGWILMDCAFIAKQYRTFGYVTDSVVLVTIMQTLYVLDGIYMEPAILTTIDIINDGFGFMLAFGDLVWVPFIYSTQTRYLSSYPNSLGWVGITGISTLLLIGFGIFRLSNLQKNIFRNDPKDPRVAHIEYMETKSGSRLMTSGWWGVARHINYCGDWIQAWPYSLPTGFAGYTIVAAGTIVSTAGPDDQVFAMTDGRVVVQGPAKYWGMLFTYFYVLYFAVLLVHRDGRDDEKCSRKYGADWEKYKSIVRWRIIPGIY
ncbi:Delta14-sterol reductase [Microdochium nivale]|nr:Delta14-sterol reductase [Microdochium nivale]